MGCPPTVATGCFGLASAFCAETAAVQKLKTNDSNAILKWLVSMARVYLSALNHRIEVATQAQGTGPADIRSRLDGLYCTVKATVLLLTDCVVAAFFEPELKAA